MPQQLVIILEDNGNISLNGPIGNRMLCYGMMECAKEAIHDYAEANKKLVQPAGGPIPPLPRQ